MIATDELRAVVFAREEQLVDAVLLAAFGGRPAAGLEWECRSQVRVFATALTGRSAETGSPVSTDLVAIGTAEAERHHALGAPVAEYLHRAEHHRRAFLDLVGVQRAAPGQVRIWEERIDELFDTVENAYCQRWMRLAQDDLLSQVRSVAPSAAACTEARLPSQSAHDGQPADTTTPTGMGPGPIGADACPVCVVAMDGTICAANPAARALLAQVAEGHGAGVGSSLVDVLPGVVQGWIASGRGQAREARIDAEVNVQGRSRWFEVRLEREAGAEDAQRHTRLTFWDVTHRRATEDAARLRAVGQLAGGVAHEFNNILASMRMCAELAIARQDADTYRRLADLVLNLSVRGAQVTRDLIELGRPARDGAMGQVELSGPILGALTALREDLVNAQVSVKLRGVDCGQVVYGDEDRLQRVFEHLTVNALHAMPEGGTLSVDVQRRTAPGTAAGNVVVVVSDTGAGIPAESMRRVFEPFFTSKGRLAGSETPGNGLGLPVSRAIVRGYGGDITLASVVGCGTTVEVRLLAAEDGPD